MLNKPLSPETLEELKQFVQQQGAHKFIHSLDTETFWALYTWFKDNYGDFR